MIEEATINTDALAASVFMTRGKDIFDPRGQRYIPIGMNCLAKPIGSSADGWYSVNMTYANGYSSAFSSTGTVVTDEWKYNPIIPTRWIQSEVLDEGDHEYQLTGTVVPAGAGVVVLCLTVEASTDFSKLTVYTYGESRPTLSNVTTDTDRSVTVTVIAKPNEDGKISIFNSLGQTTITVDVMGWSPVDYGMTPVSPARILDTRVDGSTTDSTFVGTGKYQPDETRNLTVLGRATVPNVDVSAVVLNVTTANATVNSTIKVWATGDERPSMTEVNANVGQTDLNLAIVKVGQDKQISIYNTYGYVDVIVDILGYFKAGDSGYTPIAPVRMMDTRIGYNTTDWFYSATGSFSADEARSLQLAGRLGIPYGIKAVAANIKAVNQNDAGSITVWGEGSKPDATVLTWSDTSSISNLTIIPVDRFGNTNIHSTSQTDVVIDVVGWLPIGQVGWGCNFLRINSYDPGEGQTSNDVIQGVYALADEYLQKNVVVCLSNHAYIADFTNPKNTTGQPSYEELYNDDHFVALFEGWITRYQNTPYAWLNPLSEPWRGENLSGWAATGTALYNRARMLGWTGVFVWDLPQWAHRLDFVASSTIYEDFLKDKDNVVLGWHVYSFGSYTDKTLWIQAANAKGIPVIVTEVGNRVYYTPDQITERLAEEDSVLWCRDSAIPYGTGFVAWAGTANISNPYVLAGEIGTPFYSAKNYLSDETQSVPPITPLGNALRQVAHDYRINNPV